MNRVVTFTVLTAPILGIRGLSTNIDAFYEIGSSRDRRHFLSKVLGTSLVGVSPAFASAASITSVNPKRKSALIESATLWQEPQIYTKLGHSILRAKELSPLTSSWDLLSPENELFYDPFLFGAWETNATLIRKMYPYGTEFVPSTSLVEGSPRYREEKVGDSAVYETHFFSTLPNSLKNQWVVNAGLGVPKSKIIADRRYNAIAINTAYKQMTPLLDVLWDPREDPTRVTYTFGAGLVTDDLRPLGEKRGEIFITSRRSEATTTGDEVDEKGNPVFCVAERFRSVTLTPGNVVVSDMEVATEFVLLDPSNGGNHIRALSRLAVFLVPNPNSREGVLWQEVEGKAVAIYDYELDMHRKQETLPSGQMAVCVETPKGVVQCK